MGRIVHAENAHSKLQWFYDATGNLIKEHHQDEHTHQIAVWKHRYDEINDRIKTIRPDGQQVDWLTYGSGHVYGLNLNGQDLVSFERDALHRETLRHYANGISQQQQYDLAGRLSSQTMLNEHENGYQNQHSAQNQIQNNALQHTTGDIIWKAEYKAWGELVSAKQRFARVQDESYARSDKAEKAKSSFFENSEIIRALLCKHKKLDVSYAYRI